MKTGLYILGITLIVLPLLVCWKMADLSELPTWLLVPGTIIPMVAAYSAAKKSQRPEWKGLQDTGVALYYGTWAVEVSILAGILAFFGKDSGQLTKASTILFAITIVCRLLENAGILQGLLQKMTEKMDES